MSSSRDRFQKQQDQTTSPPPPKSAGIFYPILMMPQKKHRTSFKLVQGFRATPRGPSCPTHPKRALSPSHDWPEPAIVRGGVQVGRRREIRGRRRGDCLRVNQETPAKGTPTEGPQLSTPESILNLRGSSGQSQFLLVEAVGQECHGEGEGRKKRMSWLSILADTPSHRSPPQGPGEIMNAGASPSLPHRPTSQAVTDENAFQLVSLTVSKTTHSLQGLQIDADS